MFKQFAVAVAIAVLTVGCTPNPNLMKTPVTWQTGSGFPEATFENLQPREVNGLLASYFMDQGYEPLKEEIAFDKESIKPADDYHAVFIKDGGAGIRLVPYFEFLSLPGKIRVVARPRIVSLGIPMKVEAEHEVSHISNRALIAVQAQVQPAKK